MMISRFSFFSRRPSSISVLVLVAMLGFATTSFALNPGDPGDDPFPPDPNCPSRIPDTRSLTQILDLSASNEISFVKAGSSYAVIFDLDPAQAIFNPAGACNLMDGVATKSGSVNVASSVAQWGVNPSQRVIVTITPSDPTSQVVFCFKLKHHRAGGTPNGFSNTLRRSGWVTLPRLDTLPFTEQRAVVNETACGGD